MAENNSAEVHALLLAEAYAPAPGRAGPPTAGGTSSEEDSEDEAAPAGDDGTEIVNNDDGGAAARLQRALDEIEAARERERLLKFRGVARGLENAAWVLHAPGVRRPRGRRVGAGGPGQGDG